jgi:hypothetical protein
MVRHSVFDWGSNIRNRVSSDGTRRYSGLLVQRNPVSNSFTKIQDLLSRGILDDFSLPGFRLEARASRRFFAVGTGFLCAGAGKTLR